MEKKESTKVNGAFLGTSVYLGGRPHLAGDGFRISRLLSFANSAKIATRALFGKALTDKNKDTRIHKRI